MIPDLASRAALRMDELNLFTLANGVTRAREIIREELAKSPELTQIRTALLALDKLKTNCQGDIGWRGLPNAIVDDYRVKHVLTVERALTLFDSLTP